MKRFVILIGFLTIIGALSAQTTYKEWKLKAESGDYEARCKYAYMTFVGDGCKADEEKGRIMLEDLRTEYLDTSKAAYLYAYSYMIGSEKDLETSISMMRDLIVENNIYAYRGLLDYYLNSIEKNEDSIRYYVDGLIQKNDAYGWYTKGLLQIEGKVYQKNIAEGVKNLEKSATISNEYASAILGNVYQYGEYGVAVDLAKACDYYYRTPIEHWNSTEVQLSLAKIYLEQKQLDSIVACGNRLVKLNNYDGYFLLGSAARLNGDENRMLEAYENGAKYKNSMCLEALGNFYSDAESAKPNIKKAIKYYEDANTPSANYQLAKLMMSGENGDASEDSYKKGLEYLRKSAAQGNNQAIYDLARIYQFGTKYTKVNYDSSMVYLNIAAENGNVSATYLVGLNYKEGRGVIINNKTALEYIRSAALQGEPMAYCSIGEYYSQGLGGLEKNCDSAFSYYHKASELALSIGDYYVGCSYLNGCGVVKDTAKAIQYFKKVVKTDDMKVVGNAYAKLGSIYKDYSKLMNLDSAMFYYKKSVDNHSGEGCYALGKYLLNQNEHVEEAISILAKGVKYGNVECMLEYAENLSEHSNGDKEMQKEAYKLYEKVALNHHDARGYVGIGRCMMKGEGCLKNEDAGRSYLEKAATMGNASGQYYTGMAYLTGLGCEINPQVALKWIKSAAEQDDVNALNMLGTFYLEGALVKKNAEKGFGYFKYAAEKLGGLEAYCNMGQCYESGNGVIKNSQKAFVSYQMAAQYNYAKGQFLLGECYKNGMFIKADIIEAIKWYKLAANQNYGEALYVLGEIYDNGVDGVEADKKLAKEYFQKAISAGYVLDED